MANAIDIGALEAELALIAGADAVEMADCLAAATLVRCDKVDARGVVTALTASEIHAYAIDGRTRHVYNTLRGKTIPQPDLVSSQAATLIESVASDASLLAVDVALHQAAASGDGAAQPLLRHWDAGVDWAGALGAQMMAALSAAGFPLSPAQQSGLVALSTVMTPQQPISQLDRLGLTEQDVPFAVIRDLVVAGKV